MANTINVTAYYGAMRMIMEDNIKISPGAINYLEAGSGKPPVQKKEDDEDFSLPLPLGLAMGDVLCTGIPGGVDCDFSTPL